MSARHASKTADKDDGAPSVPDAWKIGTSWHIRFHVSNSHGQLDVAEFELKDEEIAAALCRQYGNSAGGTVVKPSAKKKRARNEPPRKPRRLHNLREWSHGKSIEVFP